MAKQEQKMSRVQRCAHRKAANERRQAERRAAAEARQAKRDKRSAKEQLALLDKKGFAAKKEREKLIQQLNVDDQARYLAAHQ